MHRLVAWSSVLLLVVGCCCSDDVEDDDGETVTAGGGGAQDARAYDGPELTAELEAKESHPVQYTLVVEVNAPTGGWDLAHDGTAGKDPRQVRFVLTSPATDELVIQAFQRHTERVELGTDPGVVQVLVSQRQRRDPGAERQPFALAATVWPRS